MNNTNLINLNKVIEKCLSIEYLVGIEGKYSLYDLDTNQSITLQNMNESADFYHTYTNRAVFKYSYPKAVDKNVIDYLLKHKGNIWFAMHKKGTRKGYLLSFDYNELLEEYGDRIQKEEYEQLTLPLEEIQNVG